ncbi:hypothetical protein DRN73_02620 [Candidatus Pacearchaeota archaeon]|nr:MAG: hypothetical protein DRN73_02620 [Candidatus Pacearchaeota archaeon]
MLGIIINPRDFARHLKKFYVKDIKEKIAVIRGSLISILENDVPRGLFRDSWRELFEYWNKQGAKVELFVQKIEGKRKEMLSNLDGKVRVYDFSENEKAERFKDYHFTLVDNPMQIWIEGEHEKAKRFMRECEYLRGEEHKKIYKEYSRVLDEIKRSRKTKRIF